MPQAHWPGLDPSCAPPAPWRGAHAPFLGHRYPCTLGAGRTLRPPGPCPEAPGGPRARPLTEGRDAAKGPPQRASGYHPGTIPGLGVGGKLAPQAEKGVVKSTPLVLPPTLFLLFTRYRAHLAQQPGPVRADPRPGCVSDPPIPRTPLGTGQTGTTIRPSVAVMETRALWALGIAATGAYGNRVCRPREMSLLPRLDGRRLCPPGMGQVVTKRGQTSKARSEAVPSPGPRCNNLDLGSRRARWAPP